MKIEPNVDTAWKSFLESVGVAMVPPNRVDATVHLTLLANINKKMFVMLGPEKTRAFLKKSLIESLRNALKHIDGGG